jgi:predicted regulator of Ras-like GTPase activity (Roadblock/LC7/MglB family)
MSFDQELQQMCEETPGSRAAAVMSVDGFNVVRHEHDPGGFDIEALFVEMSVAFNTVRTGMDAGAGGEPRTFEVDTDDGTVLIRTLSGEYFVTMFLAPGSVVGRGRYAMRRHWLPLVKELE